MKHNALLAMAVGVLALMAWGSTSQAAERRSARMETAADAGQPKARHYRKRRPLQVNIYARRRGGYSFSSYEVFSTYSTYGGSPPPYAHVRQTPSGPFDSGFFFDSGIGPRGGDSPYLN
jgi:hypothetical protein